MFCKYCGKTIADGSTFCTYCGRQLTASNVQEKETAAVQKKDTPVPFILMLMMLGWSTLYVWWRMLIYGNPLGVYTLFLTASAIAGIVVLCVLSGNGKIRAKAFQYTDIALLACVWMIVPMIMSRLTCGIMGYLFGYASMQIWRMSVYNIEPALGFSCLWVAMGLAAMGLARGGWRVKKRTLIILGAAILTCSLFGVVFTKLAVMGMGLPAEVINGTLHLSRVRMAFYWMWPPLVLMVFYGYGCGKLKLWEALLVLLVLPLAQLLLVLLFVVLFHAGVVFTGAVSAFVPLLGYLTLFVLQYTRKGKTGA